MKIILPGYDESKRILAPASYLVNKYIPKEFDVYWLNYGDYTGELFRGTYVSLDVMQFGMALSWAKYLTDFLNTIEDDVVILGLDDYFILEPMNTELYKVVLNGLNDDKNIVSGRLGYEDISCKHEPIPNKEYLLAADGYLCTAQYNLWKRKALLEILTKVNTPWQFEVKGTQYMRDDVRWETIAPKKPALVYNNYSVLSPKWEGLRYENLSKEDFRTLRNYGYL